MASVNKAILVGNLGKDPEIKTLNNGDRVAHLSVATSEAWRDKQTGERRERTEWHRVVIFNEPIVRVAEQYLSKGSKVYLEGRMETRKWQDQSGADRYVTEIVMRAFGSQLVLLGGRDEGGGQRAAANSGGGRANVPADDDEIPF